jgi:LuxR family maltose regulon positive regulatory protein
MSGPGVLLATKLHVLRPPPGFVPRRRLVEALGEGLTRGRVLVSAPAGFGKTALLADWARGGGQPVAWLGLDGGDSDPVLALRGGSAVPGPAGAGRAGGPAAPTFV